MLLAIDTGNTNTLFAVHDGKEWREEQAPTTATLFAVRADERGVVHAVGQGGVVLYKRR